MSNEQMFFRPQEAARKLGVSVKTIHRWDAAGKIRTIRTVGNQRRIPASEVTRLLSEEIEAGENKKFIYVGGKKNER